jgi:hypothetical protein
VWLLSWSTQASHAERSSHCEQSIRKNKATFYGVSPTRVRPLPATLLPLVPVPGVGPLACRGTRLARSWLAAPHASGGPALVAAGRPQEGRDARCQRAETAESREDSSIKYVALFRCCYAVLDSVGYRFPSLTRGQRTYSLYL